MLDTQQNARTTQTGLRLVSKDLYKEKNLLHETLFWFRYIRRNRQIWMLEMRYPSAQVHDRSESL
jgi:hypothetical protein